MGDADSSPAVVSAQDLASARHNINLLRSQARAGQVDAETLLAQLDRMSHLLDYVERSHEHFKHQWRFEALYNVSRLLGASLDLQEVLDQVMDAIIQLTGADRGYLVLRDDDGQVDVKAARNLDQQTMSSDRFKYSRTIVYRVLDTGESLLTTNAATDPQFAGNASIIGQGLRSIMAAPLRVRGRVIGVVYVDSRVVSSLFEADDLVALEALAGQAGVALENARLFAATDQKLAEHVEELQQLRRIDLQLNETLNTNTAMRYTLDWACRVSDAEFGYLTLMKDDHLVIAHRYGVTNPSQMPDKAHHQRVRDVLAGAGPMEFREAESGRTVLILPVQRDQSVLAVLILEHPGSFSATQRDLVERVIARAAIAIENARLYAAVQAADRAKSEFVGVVAHDLKVPMTSILGYADLVLMDGGLQPQQIDFVERIRDMVMRMEKLVSDLADISRIESGHFLMSESEVDIDSILKSLHATVMMQIQARGHQFVEDVEPDLPRMWVDYYRLLQILTNLVSNAYKYTPDGGTIRLEVRREGDAIRFSVHDSGIGLSPEALKKLGKKFWRADDEFTRAQPGSGLGFAITRSLVEQMGSTIEIASEVGKGSRFSFRVPIATDALIHADPAAQQEEQP
jgi:signal transduction histidine kinase